MQKIYLNFSDPWPKARHAKRRLTSREFLARYEKILIPEGVVEFKTDNRELFEFSLKEVKEKDWELLVYTFDLHHQEDMMEGNVTVSYTHLDVYKRQEYVLQLFDVNPVGFLKKPLYPE